MLTENIDGACSWKLVQYSAADCTEESLLASDFVSRDEIRLEGVNSSPLSGSANSCSNEFVFSYCS